LRSSLLIAVAKPQLSFGSFALFPADPLFRGPIARLRDYRLRSSPGAWLSSPCNPQHCSTSRAELVIIHAITPPSEP